MESAKEYFKWSAFVKRQAKFSLLAVVGVLFLWHGLELWDRMCELVGWEPPGYTSGEQRKYRFVAMGFVGMYIVGTVLGIINMWRYRKYPELYDDK